MTDDTAAFDDHPEVRAALGELPVIEMPDDVVARLSSALADASTGADEPGGYVAALATTRHRQERHLRRSTTLMTVAAGVAAVLVISGVVVSQLTSSPSGSTPEGVSALNQNEAVPATPPVVATDTNYDQQHLPQQLNTVLAAALVSPSAAPNTSSGPRMATDQFSDTQRACVTALEAGSTGTPLLLDYAKYQGKPALVVAFAGRVEPNTVEVFVVSRQCAGANLQVYYYRVVDVAQLPALARFALPSPSAT